MYKIIRTGEEEVTVFRARFQAKWMAEECVEVCQKLDEKFGEKTSYEIEEC